VILAAIFDFLIGTIMGPRAEEQRAKGFKGFSGMCESKLLKPIIETIIINHEKIVLLIKTVIYFSGSIYKQSRARLSVF